MRTSSWLCFGALFGTLTLGACGGNAPPPDQVAAHRAATKALRGAPLIPGAKLASTEIGSDAIQTVFTVDLGPDSVADWYRKQLVDAKWNIVGDATMADSSISLHATRNGPPLWVMIQGTGVASSRLTLIGAVPDSTADTTGRE